MATSARSSVWKTLIVIIAIVAVAAGGWYYWIRSSDKVPDYSTITIARGDVVQVVTATGILQSPTSVNVSSQVSGLIDKLLVDYNTPVKTGQVLAHLDPATYQSKLQQAEAQLANTQADYTLVRLNAERTRELRTKGLVAQQDLDTAEAQLGQADAQMKIQQANVDSAKVDLSRCTIYSPIDGIVLDRQCDIGNTVAASLNAPTLFTIAQDLSKMQIDTAVAEADIGNVASGQDVNFTVDAFPNQQFNGKVTQMRNSPKTVSNVVTYDVIIEVHNENERLKPGMTANVSIIVDRASNVLRVVNSALRVRIPAELLSKIAVDPAATGHETTAPAAKPMTDDERRAAMRQIMQEVGFTRGGGGGQPAPEILQKAQQLAKERGLDLDFNQFAGGGRGNRSGGRGERGGGRSERAGSSPASSSPGTTRTLYKLVGSNPRTATIEAARVKLGITDGIYTAVLDGLTQGDILITSVSLSGSTSSPTEQPTTNPFIGRGGGGGRGGRGGF